LLALAGDWAFEPARVSEDVFSIWSDGNGWLSMCLAGLLAGLGMLGFLPLKSEILRFWGFRLRVFFSAPDQIFAFNSPSEPCFFPSLPTPEHLRTCFDALAQKPAH